MAELFGLPAMPELWHVIIGAVLIVVAIESLIVVLRGIR